MIENDIKICERFKEVRTSLNMKQGDFAKEIKTTQGHVSDIENKRKGVSDRVIEIICLKYRVNESWLRTGEGEMFVQLPEEDEVAAYVSDLLEDDGENPLYLIIKEIMHTYNEVSPKSQEVLRDFSKKLLENLVQKKES